ncbi:MAG TPA: lipid A deacylase LpxR family protein [Opitutales bacterium]|nr:lipid A deacylase LpxR family protein [Opitutales bacterium]
MSFKKRASRTTGHFFVLALAVACPDGAATAANEDPQLIVQWDNDLLTGTDDGYTNGVRIAYARSLPADGENFNRMQAFLKALSGAPGGRSLGRWRFPEPKIERIRYGVGLTQLMFTPGQPELPEPERGERPYAGWLGLEFSLQASGGHSSSTATLSIGTTGRHSYAEDNQKWVHRNISDSPIFQGWETQAPSELTLNLHFDHKRRLAFLECSRDWPVQIDGFREWGAALGNFRTDAYLGALLRAGYNLPATHTTPRVQLGSFTNTLFGEYAAGESDFSLYGFVGVRGYAVLHDISLDGPVFRDWEESADSEPWVGELSFGVAARWRQIEVSLAHSLRSREFEHQRNRSRFGSVMLRAEVAY